ncbi:MAG: hypothetical protein JWN40_4651 [Phycisphaerales bacterium]|nr:hypothetical protein [Phycisphaerales bacterium]
MNYHAILSANAQNDIRGMPLAVARYTLLQLQNLQEFPTSLSVRSHFPFREKCQLFSFDYDWEGRRYFINVLFQYGMDEMSLFVLDAPWQVAEEWWEG